MAVRILASWRENRELLAFLRRCAGLLKSLSQVLLLYHSAAALTRLLPVRILGFMLSSHTDSRVRLPAGKLPNNVLQTLLQQLPHNDPRLLVGPQVGVDAAVVDFGEVCLVAKTDPITFATDAIGWYAVNVNANDIAVMGATPRWFMASILLPAEQATTALAQDIFQQIGAACAALHVTPAGGHTEITPGIDRPIVVGVMLGEAPRDRILAARNVQPGDALTLIGSAAIEGTALIAREKASALLARGLSTELLRRAQDFLHRPGISIVRAAQIAAQAVTLHALHDPTEGGLATGIWEMAHASGIGMTIDFDAVPVAAESAAVCAAFDLDPLGVIASGALLAACSAADSASLLSACQAAGLPAAVIGYATAAGEALLARRGGQAIPYPYFAVDEIARLFAG